MSAELIVNGIKPMLETYSEIEVAAILKLIKLVNVVLCIIKVLSIFYSARITVKRLGSQPTSSIQEPTAAGTRDAGGAAASLSKNYLGKID